MTKIEVKSLQRGLNAFTNRYLAFVSPIVVDGRLGKSTRERVRLVKYHLGYLGPINSDVTVTFRSRMWHPNSERYSTKERIARGKARRVKQRKDAHKNHVTAVKTSGVGRFDGVPVANVAIPYLQWARAHGWQGRLVSGYRTPAYSESLCYRMCGRPSCPGRCAGRSTNHAWAQPGRFAVDVSDYVRFGRVIRGCPIRPAIYNRLGALDPVHFSPSGN